MTQTVLGKKIGGVEKNQISNYESGKIIPSAETLLKLSKVLEVSIDYLINDDIKDINFTPKIRDKELLELFGLVDKLPDEEKQIIKGVAKAVIFQHDIKSRVTG